MAPLAIAEMDAVAGLRVTAQGFDGRADVVLFDVERPLAGFPDLRTVEDLFVEVGRTLRADGDRAAWIADRIWRPERVQRALSLWASMVRPLSASMTFRVIARVLQETTFLRTDLRRELARVIAADRPRWRLADPAQIEVWISEYRRGRLVAGFRVSTASMRQHGGREAERQGALRPTVAAGMVHLAGPVRGALLDPCCGSGTILGEAQKFGWDVRGFDIDPTAVGVARRNVPGAAVVAGDVRGLPLADGAVGACVSNLPFGHKYTVPGDPREWLGAALREMARVTDVGGRVVLLVPEMPPEVVPDELRLIDQIPVRLLGKRTTVWVHERF